MSITAYIINLISSSDRREYMAKVMQPLPYINPVFVEAVDGKKLTADEVENCFNKKEAFKHYGREIRATEIGCTLSHKKCARSLLDSNDRVALIVEDDLIWQTEDLQDIFSSLNTMMDCNEPIICLLSGDYWYYKLSEPTQGYQIASVWDAVCAQAYFINRAAAEKLLSIDNWHLADDWYELRREGITLKALFHHVADQNRAEIKSVIAEKYAGINRRKMTTRFMIRSCWRSLIDKVLVWCGHFEEKSFKW